MKRALEAGQRYCILYVNRNYLEKKTDGTYVSIPQTGRVLFALNYTKSVSVIKAKWGEDGRNEFVLYDDIYGVSSSDEAVRMFIWEASADWEVFSLMNEFSTVGVSNNTATNGAAATAFIKNGGGRSPGLPFFMGGTEGSYNSIAYLSRPQYKTSKDQRWELFFDYNRDVIVSGSDSTDHMFYGAKYSILFGKPYYRFYGQEAWTENFSGNKTPKDGRYVSTFSPLITSYVAAANGKDAYTYTFSSNDVTSFSSGCIKKITNKKSTASNDQYMATFGSGEDLVVLSKCLSGEERARNAAKDVGFYINYRGEVVSVGNDAKAKQWAENAGCIYYINANNYYVALDINHVTLPDNLVVDGKIKLDRICYESDSNNRSLFNVLTVSPDLIVRVAAIRNTGAEYYYDAQGNFVRTGFRNDVFHMTDNWSL